MRPNDLSGGDQFKNGLLSSLVTSQKLEIGPRCIDHAVETDIDGGGLDEVSKSWRDRKGL